MTSPTNGGVPLWTVLAVALNVCLGIWVASQYLSDAFFQAYANSLVAEFYPFIIFTLGIGSATGVGYLLLRIRSANQKASLST